jgi:hypothetical protein
LIYNLEKDKQVSVHKAHFHRYVFYLINLIIYKYTNCIIVLQFWNTTASNRPTERKKALFVKKVKFADIDGKDLMLVRRAVWYNRRKVLPPVQNNLSDFHKTVDRVQHITYRGEKFVLQKDWTNHIIILGCDSSLKKLAAADVIFNSWHFRLLSQVFTIHCAENRHRITFLFCLLVKKLETHTEIFHENQ